MVIFSENPRISFPVNMSPKVVDGNRRSRLEIAVSHVTRIISTIKIRLITIIQGM